MLDSKAGASPQSGIVRALKAAVNFTLAALFVTAPLAADSSPARAGGFVIAQRGLVTTMPFTSYVLTGNRVVIEQSGSVVRAGSPGNVIYAPAYAGRHYFGVYYGPCIGPVCVGPVIPLSCYGRRHRIGVFPVLRLR
jgi:hypothetical protein